MFVSITSPTNVLSFLGSLEAAMVLIVLEGMHVENFAQITEAMLNYYCIIPYNDL